MAEQQRPGEGASGESTSGGGSGQASGAAGPLRAIDYLRHLQAQQARPISVLPKSGIVDREREQRLKLRGIYGTVVLGILAAQLITADALVYMYAWKGVQWKVDPVVLEAWLAATVIEVVGVVLVVTRSLFPSREPDGE